MSPNASELWKSVWFSGSLLVCQVRSNQNREQTCFLRAGRGPSRGRPTTSPLLLTLPISITSLLHWSTSLVMQSEGPRSFPRVSRSYFHLTCRVIYPTSSFQCELLTLKIPNMEIILKNQLWHVSVTVRKEEEGFAVVLWQEIKHLCCPLQPCVKLVSIVS